MKADDSKQLVLLTGAAGNIGQGFRDEYSDKYSNAYRLRLGDFKSIQDNRFQEIVQFNLMNFNETKDACHGVDTIIHLAANPDWQADFNTGLLDPNIIGNYNLFEAARQMGVKRVIYASSVHAIMGYPVQYQVHHDDPPKADTMYGVTKVFGEALCSSYNYLYGMSCIAVRIGAYIPANKRTKVTYSADPQLLDIVVTQRDLCQLFHKLVLAPESIKFLIANGLSKNRFRRMDIEYLDDLVGYKPEDDAFKMTDEIELGQEVKV